jgi:flagellum-specific ATP synthase
MMDSVTRFAMAQREIGLSAGEPPTAKGYTPTVFTELPRLLERAGPGTDEGTITGVFTVLVDGDDHNEPVADAVRGILDGHIYLSRKLADANHFPAIEVLGSVSRLMPAVAGERHRRLAGEARELLAAYESARDLIEIGAYVAGSNPAVDRALAIVPELRAFLRQSPGERTGLADGIEQLEALLASA